MIPLPNKLLNDSLHDLYEDFEELLYLLNSQRKKLDIFASDIGKIKNELRTEIYSNTSLKVSRLQLINNKLTARAEKNKNLCLVKNSEQQLARRYKEKLLLFELIRTHYSDIAALITSIDWQSPSFLHSIYSMAGKQTGRIVGTENDYKRDQHLDGLAFQNAFRKEYIDGFFKMSIQVFATNSGMSAFATILNFLQMNKKISGPILIGNSIYFENKTLVNSIFKNVIQVNEENMKEVCETIKRIEPSVIIFDSLSNTVNIPVPNLTEIIKYLIKHTNKETYLLIDNTGLSVSYQILKQTIGRSTTLHTIVFESLNKYYQFGMDRVTGGILWLLGKEGYELFRTREFSGTNISDYSSQIIPTPNRKLLTRRLERLERNTMFLASNLQDHIDKNPDTIISHVAYPGLANHPSFSWAKNAPFHGSFFTLVFKPKYQKVSLYKKFVQNVITEAKKQNVDVVSGTSFGFNTTRIYLTALHSEFGDPFIRVSVGTEPMYFIEKIKDVFINVLGRSKK